MKTVIYRAMNKSDFDEIKQLICNNFKLNRFYKEGPVLDEILNVCLYSFLEDHTYNQVATYKGEVIGVVMAQAATEKAIKNTIKYKFKKQLHKLKLKQIAKKMDVNLTSFDTVLRENDELKKYNQKAFDGAVTLLIVSDNGLEKNMNEKFVEPLRKYWRQHYSHVVYLMKYSWGENKIENVFDQIHLDTRTFEVFENDLKIDLYSIKV